MINGFDSLILTKLDVLDHLQEIPVCVAYEVDGKRLTDMPARQEQLLQVKPVYEVLPGWQTQTRGVKSFAELPELAKAYLRFLEKQTGVETGCVSTGPERTETMVIAGSRLEKLIG